MRIQFQPLPRLALFLLGLFAGILVITLATLPPAQQINQSQLDNYGRTMARMASQQAVDAAFNHDLLRLQVILQGVMENPLTQLATIHDVENNLLVQAGDSRKPTKNSSNYTAAILLHDSIAGYLGITLQQPTQSLAALQSTILWFELVLAAMIVWLIWRSGSVEIDLKQWLSRLPAFNGGSFSQHTDQPSETLSSTANDIAPISLSMTTVPCVYTTIRVKNLTVLKQQLNGASLRKTLTRMETIIADVVALYSGYSFSLEGECYVLRFPIHESQSEALFRASCSGYLIVELASIIHNIPLDLAAFVSVANPTDESADPLPGEHPNEQASDAETTQENEVSNLPIVGLALDSLAARDPLIGRRLLIVDVSSGDDRKLVTGFRQPYQNLLENQRVEFEKLSAR